MDDTFMSKVFEDKRCTEELPRIIIAKDNLKVKSVKTQYVIDNLQGHSIRLDIRAVDGKGKIYTLRFRMITAVLFQKEQDITAALLTQTNLKKAKIMTNFLKFM